MKSHKIPLRLISVLTQPTNIRGHTPHQRFQAILSTKDTQKMRFTGVVFRTRLPAVWSSPQLGIRA